MTTAARTPGVGPKTRLNLVAAIALLNLEEDGLRRSLTADLNTLGDDAHDPPPAFLRRFARWQDVLEELGARLDDPFLAAIGARLPDLNRLDNTVGEHVSQFHAKIGAAVISAWLERFRREEVIS
jgi:hypothetical protein